MLGADRRKAIRARAEKDAGLRSTRQTRKTVSFDETEAAQEEGHQASGNRSIPVLSSERHRRAD